MQAVDPDLPGEDDDEDLELEPDDSVFDEYAAELNAAAELFGKRDDER